MIFSTQALVLNNKNYGDTSVICNLFSVDHGKFAIIAKGARAIKNPMGAILQPLNQIECIYYYKSGRNIQILKEASIVDKYFQLENSYTKMNYALTISDIINHINYVESPSKIIFRLAKKILESINKENEKYIDILFVFFQLQCLIYLGYQPVVDKCFVCDVMLNYAKFDISNGQLTCDRCTDSKIKLDDECLKIIRFLMKTHIDNIVDTFAFDFNKFDSINYYLYKYILYHFPDIRKSRALANRNLYHG